MILFLNGSSDIGRAVIAQQFVRKQSEWRHLAMDDIRQITANYDMDVSDDDATLVKVACHLASELKPDGIHIIISSESAPHMVEMFEEEMDGDCRSVHLGTDEDVIGAAFDCILDTAQTSVDEVCKILGEVVRA